MLRPSRRADALVFSLVLLATGYFHQGGGWNQNSRFALVRSIVDGGTVFIDDYLVYDKGASGDSLVRLPVDSGNFERAGTSLALAWRSPSGSAVAIDPKAAAGRKLAMIDDVAATGDVAYFGGHFHPNKAPGPSLLAAPGYALVRAIEALTGDDPDNWATLTRNAWLASLLSVGLATALAAVLVLRLARGFASEFSARLAALTFALATMAFPLGTMLYEHNIIAAAFVAAVYCIERAWVEKSVPGTHFLLHAAGIFAGFAAITNYTMALLVPAFALYAFVRSGDVRTIVWYGLGVAWPLAAICLYNQICFGTPFTTNYAYQSEMFQGGSRLLGVFALPQLDVLAALLVSPFRGLFFTSPVLAAAVAALLPMWRSPQTRALAGLVAAASAFLLLVNASFNGWDGGWTAAPRYLGPGMALLGLPLAVAFDRWRSVTCGLAACSFVIQLLLTVVDPQVPVGDAGIAGIPVSQVAMIDPMTRYVLPLFLRERAWPMLEDSIEQASTRAAQQGIKRGDRTADIERGVAQIRSNLRERIDKGEGTPFALGGVAGPVSANPIGAYEGYYYRLFPAGSPEAAGNSFNLGELVFDRSRLSLLPLLLFATALLVLLFQSDEESSDDDSPSPAAAAVTPPQAPTARASTAQNSPPAPPRKRRRK